MATRPATISGGVRWVRPGGLSHFRGTTLNLPTCRTSFHASSKLALGAKVAAPFILGIWAQRSPVRRCRQGSGRKASTTLEDLDVTKSRFCHGWSIAQLRKGYRYCADDILCAYFACQAEPDAKRMLDLGSGIGSIGLAWLAQQPTGASCTMLEAQEISVELCRQTLRSCEINAVDLRHGDLRDDQLLKSLGNFDVVTANPPYLPQRSGNLPDNSQKAHCRHELRGGISEFCSAAAQLISPHGSFCMIHAAPRLPDVLTALRRYDFKIRRRVEIFFRGNYKSVAVVCSPAALADSSKEVVETLHIIEEDGSWSPGYLQICAKMGL